MIDKAFKPSFFSSPTQTPAPKAELELSEGFIIFLSICGSVGLLIVIGIIACHWNDIRRCCRRQNYQNIPAANNPVAANNVSTEEELSAAVDLDPYEVTGESYQNAILLPNIRR